METIARATAEDLRSVAGIGERIAGALRWSVEEVRCSYEPCCSDVQSDLSPAFIAAAASDLS